MSDHEIEEIEVEAEEVYVSSQPIELYKVLKIANVVGGGGEAKVLISDGYVAVNGEIELRKRRKMYDGDVVQFNDDFFVVLCEPSPLETKEYDEPELEAKQESISEPQPLVKPRKKVAKKKSGRRPIKF